MEKVFNLVYWKENHRRRLWILGKTTRGPNSRSIENNCINSIPYIPMCNPNIQDLSNASFNGCKVQMDLR